MLEFKVQVSKADFYAANRALFHSGWKPRNVLIAFACSTVMLAGAAFVAADQAVRQAGGNQPIGWPTYEPLALAVAAAFAALFLASRFVTCWFKLRGISNQQYTLTGTMELPTTYQLSQERFRASYSEGTSDHPWTRFLDYVDAGSVVMLRRTPGFMFIIPKHSLSAAHLDELLTLLVEVGIKRF